MPSSSATPETPAAEPGTLADADFRPLFEGLSGLHVILRPDAPLYTIAGATDAYLHATRVTRADVLGRGFFEAFVGANPANAVPAGVDRLRASLDEAVATGREHRMAEQRHDVVGPDGRWEERYWAPRNRPLLDAEGQVRAIVHTAEDVTEAVRQRQAARAAEDRLEAVFAQLPVAIAVTLGPEQRFVLANAAYRRLTGAPDAAVTGRTAAEVFPGDEAAAYLALLNRAYQTGDPVPLPEAPALRAGVFAGVYQPLHDAAGRVMGVATVAADVTAQVEARRAVEAANEQLAVFAALTEHSNDAQFLTDELGRLHWANRLACEQLGYTRAELLAADLSAWHPRVTAAAFPAYFERARRGRVAPFESVHRRKDGSEFPVEITATVVELSEGARMLAAVRDISERKRAEAERERLLREVEAANSAKSQFLATMSHELRTPLNAIGGYAELMELGLRGPVTPEQREDLLRIQRSERHLLGLINEILNYARLDAGAVAYARDEVPLDEVLAACEALVAPQVRARGLRLVYAGCDAPGGSARACADGEKVRQVVLNLLSNAVKFTAAGGWVTVSCAAEGDWVFVRVADTGLGIASEDLARVFEPFVQVDARLTRAEEGTGLGLAISRDLARGMGGNLTAESALGAGSTFTLVLPAAAPAAPP